MSKVYLKGLLCPIGLTDSHHLRASHADVVLKMNSGGMDLDNDGRIFWKRLSHSLCAQEVGTSWESNKYFSAWSFRQFENKWKAKEQENPMFKQQLWRIVGDLKWRPTGQIWPAKRCEMEKEDTEAINKLLFLTYFFSITYELYFLF